MPASPRVEKILSSMSLKQKAGQCFTFGFSGGVLNPTVQKLVTELHAGGLRYTPHYHASYAKYKRVEAKESSSGGRKTDVLPERSPHVGPVTLLKAVNWLQDLAAERPGAAPLHFSFDSEGGCSADIMRGGYPLYPAMMGLACADDPEQMVYLVTRAIARLHRASGMHFIHSPVLDVNLNVNNPEINVRSFGDTPEQVARLGLAALRGYTEGGIAATAKHFPGRGDSDVDAHYELPVSTSSRQKLWDNDLFPYRALIAEGLPSIMLAHNVYPALGDDKMPATVSPIIVQKVIREELGFTGVITTDSITMEGILKIYPADEASAQSLKAGVDLVLFKNEDYELCCRTVDKVVQFVQEGQIPESELDEKVRRILSMKERFGLLDCAGKADPQALPAIVASPELHDLADRAAGAATLLVRDRKGLLPIKPDAKVLVVEQSLFLPVYCNDAGFHPYMLWQLVHRRCPEAGLVKMGFGGAPEMLPEVLDAAAGYDVVLATNLYSRGAAPNTPFIDELAGKLDNLVVVTNAPMPFAVTDAMDTVLCTFSEFTPSLAKAVEVLYGDAEPGKRWPIEAWTQ